MKTHKFVGYNEAGAKKLAKAAKEMGLKVEKKMGAIGWNIEVKADVETITEMDRIALNVLQNATSF